MSFLMKLSWSQQTLAKLCSHHVRVLSPRIISCIGFVVVLGKTYFSCVGQHSSRGGPNAGVDKRRWTGTSVRSFQCCNFVRHNGLTVGRAHVIALVLELVNFVAEPVEMVLWSHHLL
ncbi:hypothetical protein CERZMDRAFT_120120, partial [Cercospora zeae-maydis SCOH1-5]